MAAPSNVARGADKDAQQYQLALGMRHYDNAGNEYEVSVFGVLRDLANPLAAPPDINPGPTAGTFVAIDRAVGGIRLERQPAARPVADLAPAVRREQTSSVCGTTGRTSCPMPASGPIRPSSTRPRRSPSWVRSPQLQWSPVEPLLLSGGARYDWVRFELDDHYFGDGFDDSGTRTMSALSGNVGASWSFGDPFVPYVNVSTSFETPTTTELVNQPDGSGGFNPDLGPQRAVNYEIGARGQPTPRVTYSVALFIGRITDAIVQVGEIGGRAFFGNAGKTHNDGAEVGLTVTPGHGPVAERRLHVRPLPVCQRRRGRQPIARRARSLLAAGSQNRAPTGFFLDADHTISTSRGADDANQIIVDSWGAGVTNLRLGWQGDVGLLQFGPFLGLNNLWDRQYVGSVTLNGLGGRVFEPAPRRVVYFGTEIGYRAAAAQ